MSRIFLSHSSKDNFAAIALRDFLVAAGFDEIFLDLDPDRGIAAGERWERALHAAAQRCEAVIFLISTNWLSSGWCFKEYALARQLNKKLFAVIIDPAKSIADLPPEFAGTWQAVNLTSGQDGQIFQISLPGSHEEGHVIFSAEGLRRLKSGLDKAGLDPKFFAWPPPNDPDRAPYRGLKPLEDPDSGIFFGRNAPIIEALDRLRGLREAAPPRIMAVLGASGAGKSSFLRAGLWPRLKRDDVNFLTLPIIRPERTALYGEAGLLGALEKAFPARGRAELRQAIAGGVGGVRPLLLELARTAFAETLGDASTSKLPLILIGVDQAEELFRGDGSEEGIALLGLLRDLAIGDDLPVAVIFGIRSDSYDALERAKPLEGLRQHTLPLLPMPRGAYSEVIEGPARRFVTAGHRLDIEPGLVQALLEDLDRGSGSDALPLLGFTLEQLFLDHGAAGALRLADYRAFGGLKGAIDRAISRALQKADNDARIPRDQKSREALLRRGFIPWFAGIDPETKSPRRNIARRKDIPDEAKPLIDFLVEEHLLTTDMIVEKDAAGHDTRIATIEPAHEALLRQWTFLDGWLKDDFGLLATLEGVTRASRDWDANGRKESWLAHQGQRLVEAQALDSRPDIAAKLDAVDRVYLAQCRAREDARIAEAAQRQKEREDEQARQLADTQAIASANKRTAQRTGFGLIAALLLMVIAGWQGFVATQQKLRAQQQTKIAQIEKARAEKTLGAAKTAVDSLIDNIVDGLKDVTVVPIATIRQVLNTAQVTIDNLVKSEPGDDDLQRSRLRAILDFTDIFLKSGDVENAMIAANQALGLARTLAKQHPDLEGQRDLAVALTNIGKVKLQAGDVKGALASYEEDLSLVQTRDKATHNTNADRDLMVSLSYIGDAKSQMMDFAGALATDEQALVIARTLVKEHKDPDTQRDLSSCLGETAAAELKMGDVSEALSLYSEDLSISRTAAKDPDNAQAQRDLSISLYQIGDAKLQSGDLKGALAAYEESVSVARPLARDMGNSLAQGDLQSDLEKVGNVKMLFDDSKGALAAYEESLTIARRLAADAGNAEAQRDLASCLGFVSEAKLQINDKSGSLDAAEQALTIDRKLVNDYPGAWSQRGLEIILGTVGDIKLKMNDLGGTRAAYDERLSLARTLAKNKSDREAQRDLAASLDRLGEVKLQTNDFKGALSAFGEQLSITRTLATQKIDAEAQQDLLLALQKNGYVLQRMGDLKDALALDTEDLSIARSLAKDPTNPDAQYDLLISLGRLGRADLSNGKRADALALLQEALPIAQSLAAQTPDDSDVQHNLKWVQGQIAGLASH